MKKLIKGIAVLSTIGAAIAGIVYFAKKKSLEDTFDDDFEDDIDDDFEDKKEHKENSNVADRSYVSINIESEKTSTESSEDSDDSEDVAEQKPTDDLDK